MVGCERRGAGQGKSAGIKGGETEGKAWEEPVSTKRGKSNLD